MSERVPVIERVARKVADVHDRLAVKVGTRVYRVWYVTRRYEGPGRNEGEVAETTWDEMRPPPRVRLASPRAATEIGSQLMGELVLIGIDRTRYTREQLLGLNLSGDSLPLTDRRYLALRSAGSEFAELYVAGSEPVMESFGWRLLLRPVNKRLPWPGNDPLTAKARGIEKP